jgi:hypothetical protein
MEVSGQFLLWPLYPRGKTPRAVLELLTREKCLVGFEILTAIVMNVAIF